MQYITRWLFLGSFINKVKHNLEPLIHTLKGKDYVEIFHWQILSSLQNDLNFKWFLHAEIILI